jgi:hypothetical protein
MAGSLETVLVPRWYLVRLRRRFLMRLMLRRLMRRLMARLMRRFLAWHRLMLRLWTYGLWLGHRVSSFLTLQSTVHIFLPA